MKKRLLSLVLCLVMVFSLFPSFAMASVYPITGDDPETALKVVFKNGSTELDTQYLQRSNSELHDPGVPQTSGNEMFRGWYLDSDFHGEKMTIKNLNDYVHENYNRLKTEGTLYVYAKVVKTYSVTYVAYEKINGSDKEIVQQVDTVEVPEGQATANYTVDAEYSPLEANQDFRGWVDEEDPTRHLYQVGDTLSVGSNKKMVARVVDGYWITFDENDRKTDKEGHSLNTALPEDDIHASYQKPVHVANDEGKNLADFTVEAAGYVFQGWYTERVGGTKVTSYSARELHEDVTLYAHWEKADTAKYRVIIWKQNLDGETYDYEETITLEGETFTDISTVTQQGTGNDAYARINNRDYKYTGFHLKEFDQSVTIKPQGSSVLNVYYDRNTYTLNFYGGLSYVADNGSYDSSKTYYGLVNGEYIPLIYKQYQNYYGNNAGYGYFYHDEGTSNPHYINYPNYLQEVRYEYYDSYYGYIWATNSEWIGTHEDEKQFLFLRYTGTRYVLTPSTEPIYSITALYGQDISENFPITGTNGVDYTGYVWEPQNSSIYTSGDVPTIEAMREENTVFQAKQYGTSNTIHMYYYTEATGNEGADAETVPRGGKTYVEHQHVRISADSGINSTEQEDYITIQGYKHDGSDPVYVDGKVSLDEDNNYTIKFYYAREEYSINYQDGTYVKKVTENGSTVEQPTGQTGSGQLKLETGVLYDSNLASYNEGGANYYTPSKTHEGYTFAGWFKDKDCTQPYKFTTMPVDGITVYAKWVLDKYSVSVNLNAPEAEVTYSGGKNFTPNYHEAITLPTPSRSGYAFVGWYADEDFTIPFINGTKIDDETDGLNTDATEGGVKGTLTIYAKWRQVLDGDGFIKVNYVAEYGTAPTDKNQYADHARSSVQSAPTEVQEGIFFRHWVVLDKYGNETNLQYYPGDELNVLEQYAKKVGNSYTMTLKAVYRNPAVDDTFLKYDANGGAFVAGTPLEITNLRINAEVTLYDRDKLENSELFLGWNHVEADADAGTVEFQPGQTVGVDDLEDDSNTLYAVWEKITPATYLIDFSAPMKVATQADEIKGATNNVLQGSNGKFVKSDTDVTYQLDKQQLSGTTVQINKAYNSVDTAMVHGVLMNVEGDKLGWKNITTIPAGSVYFDDDLTTAIPVGDGSGYNAAIAATPTEVYTAKGRYEFTFYGTGIDVYCTTDTESGYVQAMVDGNTDTIQSILNHTKETVRYNVPTISFRNLGQGTHKLVLNVLNSSKYKLDGIRVYNPVSNETYEGLGTHEQYATFINLRDALVNDAEGSTPYQDSTGNVKITDDNAISGALFIDDSSKLNVMKQAINAQTGEPIVDADDNPVMIKAYEDNFEAYKENSPKHEIYLANKDNNQQAIVFTLTKAGVTAARNGNLWIGLSAPDADANGGTVTLKAAQDNQLAKTIDVKNAVDMYYPISEDMIAINSENDTGTVMIKNTGSSMISVTNLKITGDKDIYDAANTTTAVPESVSEDAVILAVEDVIPMIFAPVTTQTVKIAANDGVDPDAEPTTEPSPEPTPDPTVEPTEQPAQNWLSQLISNFVSMLFRSIARLFGN